MTTKLWKNEQTTVVSSEKYSPDLIISSTAIYEDDGLSHSVGRGDPFLTDISITSEISLPYTAQDLVTVEPEPIQIVTDTITEQVLTILVIILFCFYVNFANLLMLYVIRREPQLHTPQYMVLCSYMICDLAYINTVLEPMAALVIGNYATFLPLEVCQFFGVLNAGFFFSMAHMVGYMAYERFVVFFRPLTYSRYFNRLKIIVTSLVIHLIGQVYAGISIAIFGRPMVTTGLNCQPPASALLYLNPITVLFFFMPPAVITGYVLFRLTLLISKHKAQVAAQSTGEEASQTKKQSKKQVFSGKRAIKMVALVSGSFLGTTVPFVLFRVALFSTGVTWKQTDARENMVDFALTRACYLAVAVLSSLANPAIYLYAQTDLRKLVKKTLGMKVSGTDDEASITQGNTSTV